MAKVRTFFRAHAWFLILLGLGLILRLLFIEFQSLSNDELSAWWRTRPVSWLDFWNTGVKYGDMHPAFYQAFLWGWVRIFGESEWSIRATSLLFFVLNCILIYRICRFVHSRNAGLFVLSFFCTLDYFIINTTYARPYNSGLFFLLLAFWALVHIRDREKLPFYWYLVLVCGLAGAMYSHYFAFLAVGILGLVSLFFIRRRMAVILCGIASVLLFIPHIPVTLVHLSQGGLGWLAAPAPSWLFVFFRELFNNSWILLVFGLAYLLYGLLRRAGHARFFRWWTLSWFVAVYLLAHLVSVLYTPILRETVMIFTLPLFLAGIFAGGASRQLRIEAILVPAIVFTIHTVFFAGFLEPTPNGVFKQIAADIETEEAINGNNSIDYAINTCDVAYLNYYLKRDRQEPITDWTNPETVFRLHERVQRSDKAFFTYCWTNNFHRLAYCEVIRRKYPVLIEEELYPNGAYFLYAKGEDKAPELAVSLTIKPSFPVNDSAEFCADFRLDANEFLQHAAYRYFVAEYEGVRHGNEDCFIVVTAERNGSLLQNENEEPVLYEALDCARLSREDQPEKFYVPFRLPEQIRPDDVIHGYIYNVGKNKLELTNLTFYGIR